MGTVRKGAMRYIIHCPPDGQCNTSERRENASHTDSIAEKVSIHIANWRLRYRESLNRLLIMFDNNIIKLSAEKILNINFLGFRHTRTYHTRTYHTRMVLVYVDQ